MKLSEKLRPTPKGRLGKALRAPGRPLGEILQSLSTGNDSVLMHVTSKEAEDLVRRATGGVPKFNKHTGLLSADPGDGQGDEGGEESGGFGAGDGAASDAGSAAEMGGGNISGPSAVGDMMGRGLGANGFGGTGLGFGGFGAGVGGITAAGDMMGKAARGAGMDVSDPTAFDGDDTGISNDPSMFGGGAQGNDQGPGAEPSRFVNFQPTGQDFTPDIRNLIAAQYYAGNPDVQQDETYGNGYLGAMQHYARHGRGEGRDPGALFARLTMPRGAYAFGDQSP